MRKLPVRAVHAPGAIAAKFQEAIARQGVGQIAQAERLYRQILKSEPRHPGALHLLGMLTLRLGDARRARELLEKSIASDPDRAEAHADLGGALHTLGMAEDALASYERALTRKPELVAALYNRGILLQYLNRPAEALDSFDRVITLQPNFTGAHFNRAVLLTMLDRAEEAIACYDRALQTMPDYLEALSNRGALLLERGEPAKALESLERALLVNPDCSKALNNRGNALRSLNHTVAAIESFERALKIDPQFFEAWRNLGGAQRERADLDAALASYDAALQLRPDCRQTLLERAEVLVGLRRYADATRNLQALQRVAPDVEYAQGLALHLQRLECDWTGYADRAASLSQAVEDGRRADYPFAFLSVADSSAVQLSCARVFAQDKFPTMETSLWKGEKYGHKKIRVAYVSGDLRNHAVSNLMVGIFEKHDPTRFETMAISFRPEEASALGRRVKAAFGRFIDVSQSSDREVAVLMRELEVDIAVDLMGFTHGLRTSVFAHRSAPVQVNYLGYPGTLGAAYFDYILADEFVIPPDSRNNYAERVVYLPDTFQANDNRKAHPTDTPSRRVFSLPESGIVFCCFNNAYKLNPQCFERWMCLLDVIPQSVLWLLAESPTAQGNLRRKARDRGIDPERLIFAPRIPYADHLARLQIADLFLDTAPFNGGTTASDALWVGLPVLTCAGEAFAARMAGSLLIALGLPELITHNLDDYEAKALELASAPEVLGEIRARLTRNRSTSALFDTDRFRLHLEAAFQTMWERTERGEPPTSFTVPRSASDTTTPAASDQALR